MIRALIFAILGLFVISIIRLLTTTVAKNMGDLFQDGKTPNQKPNGAPPPSAGGGSLKRDPVCGTYIPADLSVRKSVNGEVLYFCSPECRDKYVAQA
jgi:YHS domain-containing protein